MNSGRDDDSFSLCHLVLRAWARYSQQIYCVARQTFGYHRLLHEWRSLGVSCKGAEICAELGVRVRVAVGEVDALILLEAVGERQ